MKFLDMRLFFENALKSFQRLPFTIIDSALFTLLATIMVDTGLGQKEILQKTLMALGLGIPLFFSLELLAEGRKWARFKIFILGFLALLLYYFTLGDIYRGSSAIRLAVLIISAILFISFSPFPRRTPSDISWQFNYDLIAVLSIACFSSLVIFAGISAAFAGIDYLLEMKIRWVFYVRLLIITFGFLCVLIFLAYAPTNAGEVKIRKYPRRLEVFTKYILIPLTVFYMLILYAYIGKIIIEANWPKGGVSGFILGFSITGIISTLLIWPVRKSPENRTVRIYMKALYWLILPLSAVMFLAVWRRISDYGITESRYFVVVAAGWFALMGIYFLFSKSKSIQAIPVSLCVIGLLSSIGPWGAMSISEKSQIGRLEAILKKNNLLLDGRIQPAGRIIQEKDEVEISRILRYLDDVHGLKGIERWFSSNVQAKLKDTKSAALLLGIEYNPNPYSSNLKHFFFSADSRLPVKLTGDYLFIGMGANELRAGPPRQVLINNRTYLFCLSGNELVISREGKAVKKINLAPLVENLLEKYKSELAQIPPEDLLIEEKIEDLDMKIYLNEIEAYKDKKGIMLNSLGMAVFISVPEQKRGE